MIWSTASSIDRGDELWVTDITQHRTREGWLYRAAVLDAFSRRIVGWSIDARADATLVVNALDMAIRTRQPDPGGVVHADHGTQFASWVFGEKIRSAGLLPSFGTVGDGLDNAMMESFWSSMQIELLNRRKWKTRVELANAIFEYLEIWHNRQRRHSALGYRTPIEYELSSNQYTTTTSQPPQLELKQWGRSPLSQKRSAPRMRLVACSVACRRVASVPHPGVQAYVRDPPPTAVPRQRDP